MKNNKPKNIKDLLQWAYFAPSGDVQVRSIAYTKKLARIFIARNEHNTYKDYEAAGFVLRKIKFSVIVPNRPRKVAFKL